MGPGLMGMQPPPPTQYLPNSYDNDAVHVYEHELFMKSQEYEALPAYNKGIFEQHLASTKQKVIDAQNVGLQQQQQQPGEPDNSAIPSNGQLPVGAGVG
jgi:hypothetical protein